MPKIRSNSTRMILITLKYTHTMKRGISNAEMMALEQLQMSSDT